MEDKRESSEVKEELFKIISNLEVKFSEKIVLMNLVFEVTDSVFAEALKEGADIAKKIYTK